MIKEFPIMLYIFKGRYATKPQSVENETNLATKLESMAIGRPKDASTNELNNFAYKQAPYLFFGKITNNRRKLENIKNRTALIVAIKHVNSNLTSTNDVYEKLRSIWGFEFYLYGDFNNYIKGLQMLAVIPLKQPIENADLYLNAQSFMMRSLYKQGLTTKMTYKQPNWIDGSIAPVKIPIEKLTGDEHENGIYAHSSAIKLDITTEQFQTNAHLDAAANVTVNDMLNNDVNFDPDTVSAHDLIDNFTNTHQEWLAEKINFYACCLALKRAENRGEITHDEALDCAVLLAGVNPDWIENNVKIYEQLNIQSDAVAKGPGMEFFITKTTQANNTDWITLNDHGHAIIDYAMIGNRILEQTHYLVNDAMHYGKEAIYSNGRWYVTNARNILNSIVNKIITNAYPLISWRANIQREIVSYVVTASAAKYQNTLRSDPFANPAPYLIQFKNGTLNLKTSEYSKNKAENYLLHMVPHNYDPDKPINRNLLVVKWLTYLMNNDQTAALHFCAFLGMAFTQAYDQQEFIMLIGSGSNGKTTLLNYVKSLFESSDAVDISLTEIADSRNRFAASQLYLSHLAITSETNSNAYIKSTDVLKKLTGNESLKMEQKGLDPFVGPAYAGIISAANELPTITDRTKGIRRRMVAISMDRDFEDIKTRQESQHKFPMKELNAERGEFIKFCLHLFKVSILDNDSNTNYFQFSQQMRTNTTNWAEQGDSIKEFADSWCIKTDDSEIGEDFKDLYQLYVYDTRSAGATPMNRSNFSRNLLNYFDLPTSNKQRLSLENHQATRLLQICFNEDALSLIWDNLTNKDPHAFHLTGYTHRGSYLLAGEKLLASNVTK